MKQLDRRSFLKVTALAGGGMMIGIVSRPSALAQQGRRPALPAPRTGANPSTYIKVNPDNTFTIIAKNPETGQGIRNALPMIIADEFDVDWRQVKIEQADLDPKYGASQIEGGSTAIPTNYDADAERRRRRPAMMVAAAAQTWNVPAAELTTGVRRRHARGLATARPHMRRWPPEAAAMPPPADAHVKLKDPKDFKIIGKPIPGVDNFADRHREARLQHRRRACRACSTRFSKSARCSAARPVSANLDEIKKLPGIKHAFIVDDRVDQGAGLRAWASGVAIVADNWWLAQQRAQELKVVWDEGAGRDPEQRRIRRAGQATVGAGIAAAGRRRPAAMPRCRRRRSGFPERRQGRRGGVRISVAVSRSARAAELDGALQGRQT